MAPIEVTTAQNECPQKKDKEIYKIMPDFVSPDQESRCTWSRTASACPTKTPHTIWPL